MTGAPRPPRPEDAQSAAGPAKGGGERAWQVAVLGAGAFGTALAIAEARGGRRVRLWARDPARRAAMERQRCNARYLPGAAFPPGLEIAPHVADAVAGADAVLVAIPAQALRAALCAHAGVLAGAPLVLCAKGIELDSGLGPCGVARDVLPGSDPAILTGPGFAADIAAGLPTALVLAAADGRRAARLQQVLATRRLRVYRTTDVTGAELGGALKNVIAIAAGAVLGAGLGESARAALVTRGFAEMRRMAGAAGARGETLMGLSGLGDLFLTCAGPQSRNFSFGMALGAGEPLPRGVTVEGVATARAVLARAEEAALEMPVTAAVVALIDGTSSIGEIMTELLSRPLKEE